VEFYFSDSNLPRDKFLLSTIERTPEGWVDIAMLITFTRMRGLLNLDACQQSEVGALLAIPELCESGTSVFRGSRGGGGQIFAAAPQIGR
jgi:lupus La protein